MEFRIHSLDVNKRICRKQKDVQEEKGFADLPNSVHPEEQAIKLDLPHSQAAVYPLFMDVIYLKASVYF